MEKRGCDMKSMAWLLAAVSGMSITQLRLVLRFAEFLAERGAELKPSSVD
ncbi:unnamed protein product, partial [marine sediment metagenome]